MTRTVAQARVTGEGKTHGIRRFRPSRPLRRAALRLVRGAAQADRALRFRRLLRLSPRRASRDAARHNALAQRLPCGGGAAHQAVAVRPDGLRAAALSSAAAARGDLHARPDERRTARRRLRPRRLADRAFLFRPRPQAGTGDLCRRARADRQGDDRADAELRGPVFQVRQGADRGVAAAETASAGVVRRAFAGRGRARDAPLPKLGLGRFIVVADTDADALALARRAYPKWHDAFTFLPRLHKILQQHPRPADWDTLTARGQGFAGSPAGVTAWLRDQLQETGTNYVVGQFAFGDLSPTEFTHSVELFATHVMPALRR